MRVELRGENGGVRKTVNMGEKINTEGYDEITIISVQSDISE